MCVLLLVVWALKSIQKPTSVSWRAKALAEVAGMEIALYGDTYTLIEYDSKVTTADPPREQLEVVWDRVKQNHDLFKKDGVPMAFPVGGNDNPQYHHSGGNEKGGMAKSMAGTTNPVGGGYDAEGGNEKGSYPYASASAPPRW